MAKIGRADVYRRFAGKVGGLIRVAPGNHEWLTQEQLVLHKPFAEGVAWLSIICASRPTKIEFRHIVRTRD